MDSTAFTATVENYIRGERLLPRGAGVLIGVSGGMDSILLLHTLHELAPTWAWRLRVAHFNHRLRGRASDRDETWVRNLSRTLRIPCTIGRGDVRVHAKDQGISLEMAARQCRHQFLASTARSQGIRTVALAHHADDQVEGFFLRLLRGSGLDGLTGMKARAVSPGDRRVRLIRPLLGCSRALILEVATRRGLQWCEDATNAELEPLRNRIRHELLPWLKDRYQPAIASVVLRTIELLRGEAELIETAAKTWPLDLAESSWSDLPVALQRRRIQSQLQTLGCPVEFALVERLRSAPGTPWAIGPGNYLCLGSDGKLRRCRSEAVGFIADRLGIALEGEVGSVRFGQRTLRWRLRRVRKTPDWRRLRPAGGEVFDASRVGPSVLLRHWQPGDRFQPSGLPRSAKLQDLFVAAKIPRAERRQRVVATTAAGELFWVEGLRIGEPFKVTRSTRTLLVWEAAGTP